ncbi:MAG: beta-ketoacyl-[acyl-carrier-protein] synthase family protein, partial [Candidatus Omnitrophota bacterium]
MRRVVVTGLGVVSSIGIGKEDFWSNLIKGKSGISKIDAFDTSNHPAHFGGEVKNFQADNFINKRRVKMLGRASQLSIAAGKLAMEDAKINKEDVSGVCMGTTMGENQVLNVLNRSWLVKGLEEVEEKLVPEYPNNIIVSNIGIEFDLKSENLMFPTACAAGNYALGYANDLIRNKNIDTMIAGGVDAISDVAFTGFNRLYAMAPEKCQPFDKNRKGMLLGEGAAILVLESLEHALKRKAHIYAEILGYGLSCDAYHMTHPTEEGVSKSMEKAMEEASIGIDDVDYISAHGTGTQQNDKTEVAAIKKVFGKNYKKIPVSSIKSMLGHTMGAAAAIEAMVCCLALEDQILPPTINYETPDSECDIDCVPNKARKQKIDIALNNSCAFGGNNA